jgi:hypothetical protein
VIHHDFERHLAARPRVKRVPAVRARWLFVCIGAGHPAPR